MKLHASTLVAAGIAPLVLVLALTLAVMTSLSGATGSGADLQYSFMWALLAAGAVAMAAAAWAWGSEADRAPRRLGLGYTWAAALGMATFMAMQSYVLA